MIKPYLGAGIGYSLGAFQVESERKERLNKNINGLSCMRTLGATYDLNKNISFDLGVKYSSSSFKNIVLSEDRDVKADMKLKNISINLGARYTF